MHINLSNVHIHLSNEHVNLSSAFAEIKENYAKILHLQTSILCNKFDCLNQFMRSKKTKGIDNFETLYILGLKIIEKN